MLKTMVSISEETHGRAKMLDFEKDTSTTGLICKAVDIEQPCDRLRANGLLNCLTYNKLDGLF
jgi:hypothetical protein